MLLKLLVCTILLTFNHNFEICLFIFIYLFIFCLFAFSRAAPVAYGGSQARGLIGAIAADLHHSHRPPRI